jgi:hypothetical protein
VAARLVLWGSSALLLAPAAAALRVARPLPRMALALPAAVLLALPVLIVLARVLKTTTHHRPLGAATFAVLALGILLGALAVTGRLLSHVSREHRLARLVLIGLLAAAGLATLVLALPLLSVARGSLLDSALALGAAALATLLRAPPALERVAKIAGPVALVVAVGAGFALGSQPVRAAAVSRAPVLAGPLL